MRQLDHADHGLLTKRRQLLKVDTATVVDAPPARVWATVGDHRTWPSWHDDYEEHEAITDRTTGLGATFRSKEWWGLHSESEITRWDDGRIVGLTVRRATFWRWLIRSAYHEIEVEPDQGDGRRSIVHYRTAVTGTVVFWLLGGYTVPHTLIELHWTARATLKKLRRRLEPAAPTGPA